MSSIDLEIGDVVKPINCDLEMTVEGLQFDGAPDKGKTQGWLVDTVWFYKKHDATWVGPRRGTFRRELLVRIK